LYANPQAPCHNGSHQNECVQSCHRQFLSKRSVTIPNWLDGMLAAPAPEVNRM
jgi:hypothetical protein